MENRRIQSNRNTPLLFLSVLLVFFSLPASAWDGKGQTKNSVIALNVASIKGDTPTSQSRSIVIGCSPQKNENIKVSDLVCDTISVSGKNVQRLQVSSLVHGVKTTVADLRAPLSSEGSPCVIQLEAHVVTKLNLEGLPGSISIQEKRGPVVLLKDKSLPLSLEPGTYSIVVRGGKANAGVQLPESKGR